MPGWRTVETYPVPRDAEATQPLARQEAAWLLEQGERQVHLCKSPYHASGQVVGYRWWACGESVMARTPGSRRFIQETLP